MKLNLYLSLLTTIYRKWRVEVVQQLAQASSARPGELVASSKSNFARPGEPVTSALSFLVAQASQEPEKL